MKKVLLLVFVFFITFINAQKCIKGDIENFETLKGRSLAVVILEEDQDYIDRISKKIEKAKKEEKKIKLEKELRDYKYDITNFNKLAKELVPQFWRLNDVNTISYFTKEQVHELYKERSEEYAVLDFTEINVALVGSFDYAFQYSVSTITYRLSEFNIDSPSFRNFFTNVNYNFPKIKPKVDAQKALNEDLEKEKEGKSKIYSRENMITSLLLSQSIIDEVVEKNEKYTVESFAKEQSEMYCEKLQEKKILIQSANVSKKLFKEFDKYSDKVEMVSAQRIAEAVINREDVVIGFPTTQKLFKAKSALGPVSLVKVDAICHKMLFNPKLGTVVGFVKAPKPLNYRAFTNKDLDKLFECK